jgi:hypothetical protein
MMAGETSVDIEHYRRRLLAIERELVERRGGDVDTARATSDDPADAGDLALADELPHASSMELSQRGGISSQVEKVWPR